jgi:HK97 family phage portal protein
MSIWTKARRILARAAKAFTIRFSGAGSWASALLPRTHYNYQTAIGDPLRSSALVATLNWIVRNFAEAPLRVAETGTGGNSEVLPSHPLYELLRRPNPHYSGSIMWMATVLDFALWGNAYWLTLRGAQRRPVELWWLPQALVEPRWPQSGEVYISHYEYQPDPARAALKVEPADIVHFRWGLDPQNTRKGLSSAAALWREIFTDEEAANFSASVLRNLGVPGLILAPDEGTVELSQEDADDIRARMKEMFAGDNRGEAMILSQKVRPHLLSWSPAQLDLKTLRNIPEERISAVLGVPAAVVGLGSGLQNTKVGATMAEMREMAYENAIIPMQRIIADTLDSRLLPEFGDERRQHTFFDLSEVRVLREDQDALYRRADIGVRGGWLTVGQALRAVGLPSEPALEIYLRSTLVVPVPASEPGRTPSNLLQASQGEAAAKAKSAGRERRISAATGRLAAFLARQAAEVAERLEAGPKANEDEIGLLFPPEELAALETLLRELYETSISAASAEAAASAGGAALGQGDEARQRIDLMMGQRVAGIDAVTREALAEHLALGRERGYSSRQIVVGVPEDGYLALRDIETFGEARAHMIARTELATAENWAQAATWRKAEVAEVDILDGDGCGWTRHDDPDKASGSRRSLESLEAHPVAHPNCVRVPVPVVDKARRNGRALVALVGES